MVTRKDGQARSVLAAFPKEINVHRHDTCGKCQSGHLLEVAATPGQHFGIVIGLRLMRTVRVTKYVCTDCGYIEEWVNNKEDLVRLQRQLKDGG
jgi:hypothetical protein